MKRRLSILMVLILLLSLCLTPLAATAAESAEDEAWKQLSYVPANLQPGEQPVEIDIKSEGLTPITQAIALCFDPAVSVVRMNNKDLAPGTVIDIAGSYHIQVYNAATYIPGGNNTDYVNYYIEYERLLWVEDGSSQKTPINGRVFQCYPTLHCENAASMKLKRGTSIKDYVSGGEWPYPGEFGDFELVIMGSKNGMLSELTEKSFTFKVYPCVASQVWDDQRNMEVLLINMGNFADANIKVVLDGKKTLENGTSTVVTAVGQHSLELFVNDAKVEEERYRYFGMPTAEDLTLLIKVETDSLVWDSPRSLNFSRWDVNLQLDGEDVSREVYINENGEHVLRAVDADGDVIENCFLVKTDDGKMIVSELVITFDNPHYLYVIFMAVPAALLLIAAVVFLVLRRKIV